VQANNKPWNRADAVREQRGTRCEIWPLFCFGTLRTLCLPMAFVQTGKDAISGVSEGMKAFSGAPGTHDGRYGT
jgi:hypothetical protein